MKRNHSRVWRSSLCGALPFAVALFAGWAPPASAVRVIDVRVGQHGEFTRIVFDLDGPARYHLEHSEAGAAVPELVVHFDASAQPKVVRTLSKIVDGVRLEARPEGAVARITLRSPDVHAVEETLSSPPRIVIDLRASTPAELAAAKRPAAAPRETAEPSPPSASAPPPTPQAAAAPPPPTPAAPRTTAEVIEAQADAAAARLLGEQGAMKPGGGPPSAGPSAPAEPGTPAPAESAPSPAESASAPPPPAPSDQPELPKEGGNPPGTLGAPPPPPAFAQPPWEQPAPIVIGAVLIVLGLFVWFIFRRREPEEGIHAGALPADAFLDRMAAFGDRSEREGEEHREDAEERTEALPLFAAASASERTVEIPVPEKAESRHEDSLFEERSRGADKTVTTADLERPSHALGEREASAGIPPAPHTDESMGRMLRDVEQRLAQIEQRLARDADARERLERQVVAQTEELRVQRAAIARTQRVLRTLSRPEDLATEPVIKSPGPSGSPD
jgi:hypothetical protein